MIFIKGSRCQIMLIAKSVLIPFRIPCSIKIVILVTKTYDIPCMGTAAGGSKTGTSDNPCVQTHFQCQPVEQICIPLAYGSSFDQSSVCRVLGEVVLIFKSFMVIYNMIADETVDGACRCVLTFFRTAVTQPHLLPSFHQPCNFCVHCSFLFSGGVVCRGSPQLNPFNILPCTVGSHADLGSIHHGKGQIVSAVGYAAMFKRTAHECFI